MIEQTQVLATIQTIAHWQEHHIRVDLMLRTRQPKIVDYYTRTLGGIIPRLRPLVGNGGARTFDFRSQNREQ